MTCGGRKYRIREIVDLSTATATDCETHQTRVLPLVDIEPDIHISPDVPRLAIEELTEKEEKASKDRLEAIRPLLEMPRFGRRDVEARAREVGRHFTTLYRWIKAYTKFEDHTSLVPRKRGWRKGKTRISPDTEEIIADVIENYYLTPLRPGQEKAIREVQRKCLERNVKIPSSSTVRARIKRIDEKKHIEKRGEPDRARRRYQQATGHFPNADFPLSVVQIDHTLMDIILVDDKDREPIGRPWVTLAIDVYSRVVTGYYLSLDAPSVTSVGMCITHSIIPKEKWLLRHKVDAEWPVWGVPETIHTDNGPDFRAEDIQSACSKHGINIEFRPVKEPKFGGHIERLIGNVMRNIQGLPGSTFSSVAERGEHDSEKYAAMTKDEFERWLLLLICGDYHHRPHSAIDSTPLDRWRDGVIGDGIVPGRGTPARPPNPEDLVRDFLPSFRRTVQHDGVGVQGLKYFASTLQRWIRRSDPEDPKKTRQFTFRRDPRNISTLWFFDPDLKQYFKIPLADQRIPEMSLWEYNQLRSRLKLQGIKNPHPTHLIRTFDKMRKIEEQAQTATNKMKTNKIRRNRQRREEHKNQVTPDSPLQPEQSPPDTTEMSELSYEPVEAFETIL